MHQSINAAVQTHKDTEVGDGLDSTTHTVSTLMVHRKLLPWVRQALLHTQGNATALLINIEHHDLNLVIHRYNLAWIDVFVGPIHLGNVYQALDTVLYLNKGTVIGQIGYATKQAGRLWIATGQTRPRILAQLLDPQRYRLRSRSNLSTLTSISSPICTSSEGWRTRRQAISVICNRPSIPPRSIKAP